MNSSVAGGNSGSSFFRQYFDIQERIGFGSFGDVYRVKSKLDNKDYAVKKSRRTYAGEGDRQVKKELYRTIIQILVGFKVMCMIGLITGHDSLGRYNGL